jgi:tetratricopeptide (TPR) repeat protein
MSSAMNTPDLLVPGETAEAYFALARELMLAGKSLDAIRCAERAFDLDPDCPEHASLFALLIARERGQLKRGLELAHRAVEKGGPEPELCNNLAAIYLKAERRSDALRWVETGLERAPNHPGLIAQRNKLGLRRPPVLRFLPRQHPVNKYLGLWAHRLRLR